MAVTVLFLPEQPMMINMGKLFTFLPRGVKFPQLSQRDGEMVRGRIVLAFIREWFSKQLKTNKLL